MGEEAVDYTYNYLQYNVDQIGGAHENFRQLLQDLEELRSFVKEWADKKSNDNEYMDKLAKLVADVIFQAEDTAEKYIVYSSRQKQRRVLSKVFHAFDYVGELRKVGEECLKLRGKIPKLFDNDVPIAMIDATTGQPNTGDGSTGKKRTALENNIFGFIDAANDVKKLLLTGAYAELQVYCIVGMLGLGKSTLARQVYDDPEIKYTFFARAFVTVSQVYKKKDVLLKILAHFEAITDEMHRMPQETIRDKILEKLNGKQYLIVLDDVWDTGAWDALKEAFPLNEKRSRILITTRNSHVAHHTNPLMDPYELCFLDADERKHLLRLKGFGETGCPKDLERHITNYEVCILQKYGGLPLAIMVTAGILLDHKFIPKWWKEVHQSVQNFDHADEKQWTEIIRFSYTNLPYYMKPCFLYLGIFPEDFDIPVWKLLRLWIAEGFVQGNGNLEDIAERYLEELVDRNLVMVAKHRLNGQIKSCRVHDFLQEFCKTEAMRQNVFQELKGTSPVRTTSISRDDYLRIAVNSHVLTYVVSKPIGERVRSFLSFPEEENEMPPDKISTIPKAFQLLRVLDIRGFYLKTFPAEIYYLVLLKYIAISCGTSILATKLSYLWNLQTFIIEANIGTIVIKADISLMEKLRHLHTNTSASLQQLTEELSTPSKSKVQTLSTIAPESCTREFFERFKELKKLGVRGNLALYLYPKSGLGFFDHLSRLDSLENLKLVNDDVDAKLYSLPNEKNFPSTLTRLTLWNTFLDWKEMSTIGKLENLRVLKLKDNAFAGASKIWDVKDEGFAGLMVLHIGKTDLMQWTASAGHFPLLTTLILKHCTDLNGIPRDFANIASLQMIDLHWTNPGVVSSAKSILVLKLKVEQENEPNEQRSHGFRLRVYPPES